MNHQTVLIRWLVRIIYGLLAIFITVMSGAFFIGMKVEKAVLQQATMESDMRVQKVISEKHDAALHEHDRQISIINTRLNLPHGKE